MSILSGYRVLDCSIAMAGPFAAQRLGDLGADVVKIEPVTGEWQRHVAAGGARGNKINVSFLSLNRNKRSLAVNLKSPDGKAVLLELVKTADVFLQNYRPGVAARLGIDYKALSAINLAFFLGTALMQSASGVVATAYGLPAVLLFMAATLIVGTVVFVVYTQPSKF